MRPETVAMCHRFALLHISHWRNARGLPMTRQHARQQALWWIAAAKGKMK
jgi:hypothetical protein